MSAARPQQTARAVRCGGVNAVRCGGVGAVGCGGVDAVGCSGVGAVGCSGVGAVRRSGVGAVRRGGVGAVRGWRAAGQVLGAAVALLAAGCAHPSGAATTPARSEVPRAGPTATPTSAPARSSPGQRPGFATVLPVPPPQATQPQTRALPSASTVGFRAEMTDLWGAVVTGEPVFGMRAFFPLGAYRQVKAIADPTSDWHDRLVGAFRLDVGAAHHLLGHGARASRLVRVIVPEAQASWIDPGVCSNGVGYWHVAGARIVYRLHGQLRSIGIASLISWRGRWYVVHFGAVLRSSAAGVVDQPAVGVGVTGPPGGC